MRLLPLLLLVAPGCIDTQLKAAATEAAVNPDFVDFGTVAVGGSASAEVDVDSIGYGAVSVMSVTVEGVGGTNAFTVDGDVEGTSLGKGESLTIPLVYTPSAEGWDEADATIQTDANSGQAAWVVHLRGRAAVPGLVVSPSRIDFGAVEPGADAHIDVLVQSTSAVASQLTSATLFGDGAFYLGDLTTPLTVDPGDSATLQVSFGPSDTVSRSSVLTLVTDDPVLGTVDIAVVGNACEGDAATDADGDGLAACAGDCDDTRADVRPGNAETYDALDNDCDGITDEGTEGYDDDGDGFSEIDGDCDDGDGSVGPFETELADGIDQDCDGAVDEDTDVSDDDGDGFTERGGDCDDTVPSTSPGAAERANGVDDDCDGTVDEGTSAGDDDGDGWDEGSGDCDDANADVHPYGTETADGIDDDCDGTVDEGTAAYDDDGDGYTENGGDCDDTNANVGPHVLEVTGDGIDNDCDGVAR